MKPAFMPLLLALAVRALARDETPAMPVAELRAYRADAERELRENILPFWLKHARDPVRGGFHSFIGEDMVVRDDQPRGALLTARILWTFSAAYRRYHDPAYLEMARWALRDLREHFVDREHGGLFWTVSPEGQPVDAHKQIYVQVFGLYGLSEYFRATGEQTALDDAIAIYRLVEKYAHDPVHGGYFDSLDREWRRPATDATNLLGDAPKSQNSHIHILEGFTGLLRSWPDAGLRQRQRELVELMLTKIIDARTHHLVLFMRDDWTPIGDAISYGHDIELSWLLVEAAGVLGDADLLARAKAESLAIARVTAEGIDADGGVFNEGSPRGITNPHKEWWEQAEAAVGFLNAYQLSGDPQHLAASRRSWRFIQDKVVDRVHGDWHNTLERDGTPIVVMKTASGSSYPMAKVSLWKCPYHNGRCCLELMERLDALAGGQAEFELGAIGTGVAIGDYDGDGRPDIFVVSKTESCRLFRNLGGFKFEDVTDKAGVGDHGDAAMIRKLGAAFADVNQDGWLDFYAGTGDPSLSTLIPNRMFRNDGAGHFQEVTTSGSFGRRLCARRSGSARRPRSGGWRFSGPARAKLRWWPCRRWTGAMSFGKARPGRAKSR